MFQTFTLECGAATNTFYIPMPYNCLLSRAWWSTNADPGQNNDIVLSHDTAGATIISGEISATPGAITAGTLTSTVADKNLVLNNSDAPLKIVATTSNACKVGLTIDIDEFVRKADA